jgi:hypothetical protein
MPSELDCVPRRPDSPLGWGDDPIPSLLWPEVSDSVPSLALASSNGERSLSDGGLEVELEYPESLERSSWVRALDSVEEFERGMDQSLSLEGVEVDVGDDLLGFVDDVIVRRDEGLSLLSQVAVRSAGPPGLAGSSGRNPICLE